MTIEEIIKNEKDTLAFVNNLSSKAPHFTPNKESVLMQEQLVSALECLQEIAHIFLEHRAWGEYPSSADDMWKETIRVLDKYKIEIGGE